VVISGHPVNGAIRDAMSSRKSVTGPTARTTKPKPAKSYKHSEATSPMRPEVGTQTRFKKKLAPAKFRYDDSLSPSMEWDGQNPARDNGEWLLGLIEEASTLPAPHHFVPARELKNSEGEVVASVTGLRDAVAQLKAIGKPFLNWSGKAERTSFEVPSLPLFIHERLSTKAILETLKGHRRDKQTDMFDLFGDPQHSGTEQILRAYEHRDKWVNRMMLGDSLVVMNSLLEYELMGGRVQMIYMDPPYGVKFGSNFQPFVRDRNVTNGDDTDMTREPEMVQAYRDTWELGLHSYLTYLRDRLVLARELLTATGSIFVQISDENVHHVREVLCDVFGADNFVNTIVFQKTSSEEGEGVANTADYLLWACKDRSRLQTFPLYRIKEPGETGAKQYVHARHPETREVRKLTASELANPGTIEAPWIICRRGYPLTSQDASDTRSGPFEFDGKPYYPGRNRHWSVSPDVGLPSLVSKGLIYTTGKSLNAIMDLTAMPGTAMGNLWVDTGTGSFTDEQIYVVQTAEKVLQRCVLMTTRPGDLVFDPTCGSGTTAYVAEQWGRRWITIDASRVPLALARQRLLTATFPYFQLRSDTTGPSSGFVYEKEHSSRNKKADGYGIAQQHTLSSIAGDEEPKDLIFSDRPEINYAITRITGPFCLEATIPTPMDWDEETRDAGELGAENTGTFTERMIEVLRRSPILRMEGNRTVTLKGVRPPAKSLSLSAEALVDLTAEGQVATLADSMQQASEKTAPAVPLSPRPVA
jgi:adenine-specific DNA-methyltransferase